MPFDLYAYVCTRAGAIPSIAGEHTQRVFVEQFDTLDKAQKAAEDGARVYVNTEHTLLAHENQIVSYEIEEVDA